MIKGPFGVELDDLKRPNTAIAFTSDGVPGTEKAASFAKSNSLCVSYVVAPSARTAKEYTKGPTISDRTHGVRLADSDVALVIAPSLKLLAKILTNQNTTLIIGEWPDTPLRWFGRLTGALNIATGRRSEAGIDPAVFEFLKQLDWAGNNCWTDQPGKRDAARILSEMRKRADFEPEMVTSYMLLNSYSVESIEELRKLMQR